MTFADFDVEAPNLGFVSVEPDGFVEFSLEIAPSRALDPLRGMPGAVAGLSCDDDRRTTGANH